MPRKRPPRAEQYPYDSFFRRLPKSALFTFYSGVFLIFAPLPILIASRIEPAREAWLTIFWLIYGGAVAVAWAMSRTVSKRLLPVAIVMTIAMSLSWSLRWPAVLTLPVAVPGFDGAGIAMLLIGAYVIFVIFISGQGVHTLRMQAELDLARQIHETLAPRLEARLARMEVLARSDASAEMGGDLIDLVERPDGGTDLFLADVSGHGVKAGVVMGMVKSAIRMRLLRAPTTGDGSDLGSLLSDLNRVICQVGSPEMFVTFACMRFDRDARSIEYALAGHPPILRIGADGTVESLDNAHLPLGITEDEAYTSARLSCAPGDTFVLYTDGLTEATDASGRQLGQAGFEQIVGAHAARPLDAMFEAIFADVRARSGRQPQGDDQTLLLARLS